MDSLDETRSRMSYEVAVYKEQLNLLKKEMERISYSTIDLSNAVQSVEDLKAEHILVPIGGGAYINADIKETHVLVPIGGNYSIEMDKESALLEIHRRIDATKQAVTKLNEEFEKINDKMREVGTKLQEVERQAAISQRVEEGVKEDYI